MNDKKILIVEDEVTLRRVLVDKFENEGMRVFSASNGEDGLEIALEEIPDIILLDIIMPKKDGLTMLRELRENEKGKNIKVIILTNITDASKMLDDANRGVYDFLIKSDWKVEDIFKKVQDYLK